MVCQSLKELGNELKRGCFHPAYLVLGPETHMVRKALQLLKDAAIPPEALAFDYAEFHAKNSSVREILDAANTFPMASPRRLILVHDAGEVAEAQRQTLFDYLERPSTKSVLVLAAVELDRRTSFARRLIEKCFLVEFRKLKGKALELWVSDYVKALGCRISASAMNRLLDAAGSDLESLAGELEKLAAYAGQEQSIDESAIEEMFQGGRRYGIFELTAAIGRRDRAAALRMLGNLLEAGEAPLWIATMLGHQLRQMLIVKNLLAQGTTGREATMAAKVPSFVAEEFLRQVRSFDLAGLGKLYTRLADVDRRFKSSSLDKRMILESLIYAL